MKLDQSKLRPWLLSKETSLPGLSSIFDGASSEILIIGAAVFELYEIQGWTPPFKRRTGDIDLSIGVVGDDSRYRKAKEALASHGYRVDDYHPYRHHPPKLVPGGYAYIDLLAHPSDETTKDVTATNAMGVGKGFSFDGFEFAKLQAFEIQKNVFFPNPFGLMALKRASYIDDPIRRKKDFADIAELVSGLVERGTHFEMDELWTKVSKHQDSHKIKALFRMILAEDTRWDLDDLGYELQSRGFGQDFLEITLPQRISDFHDVMV